jgi:putative oxidoreductase
MKSDWVAWLNLVLRIVLGGVFLAAGGLKIGHPAALAVTFAAFELLPQPLVAPLAILLPPLEIGLGLYLIVGLLTRYAAGLALLQLLIYAGAIASVVLRGIHVSCGCFGQADTAPASWLDMGRDLLLAALSLPLLLADPGRFAVDTILQEHRRLSD